MYVPIYCSDAGSSRNISHCPDSCQPLRKVVPMLGRRSHETVACSRTYCIAYKLPHGLWILCRFPGRCSKLKERKKPGRLRIVCFVSIWAAKSLTFRVAFLRYQLQNDRFHGGDIAEPHFRYVQRAHHMRPSLIVGLLEGAIPGRTQFTSNPSRTLLAFAFATEPRSRRHRHNAVARLMYSYRTILAITIDEWIFRPSTLVGANTTTTDHLLHAGPEPRYPAYLLHMPH